MEQADGALAVEADGTAHVVWVEGVEDGTLYYAEVSGGNVSTQTLATSNADAPDVAVDGSGTAHVVWRQGGGESSIRYTAVGGSAETVSDTSCAVGDATQPALDVDGDGKVHVAWGGRDGDAFSSGPVCYATRDPGGGAWTRTDTGRLAQGDRFGLEVAGDGTVYVMRGVRSPLENGESKNEFGYDQESLYLERYRAGDWEALLGNTYPVQDDNGYFSEVPMSILDGDMALDGEGNAYLAWTDNQEAWDKLDSSLRLRTTRVASTTTAPQVTKHYYANGQRIATRVDGDLYYVLGDHLGSTSLVADDQGNEVGHVIYDAYGSIVTNTLPATLTDRLFTGQVFDASTGLYYYNARYYDPFAGQFTQPDSLVADPLNPAAWNRFAYAKDSPANYIDPSGNIPVPLIVFGAVAFTGAFIGGASYIANHPGEDYAHSLDFYKAVIGGELLAASLFLPFSSSVPTVVRGAVATSHILTWGSDVVDNTIARDRWLFLPRSSWKKYLGNAMGAAATGGLLHWTVLGPVWSAVAGGAARRLTINLLETNSVDPWEVGIDATVSGVQAWFFGLVWPAPNPSLDFTRPPLDKKTFDVRDIISAESGVLFGLFRNWLLELYHTPHTPSTSTP